MIFGGITQRREIKLRLSGVASRLADRRQQQGPACHGVETCAWMGGPTVPAPPVVDQRTGPRRRLAADDVLCGETAQSPTGS